MKKQLSLFIMIDAYGWEIQSRFPILQKTAPQAQKLESVFGYSSTCVPSILSGRWPDEHRNWCYFVYDPKGSPFKQLAWLKWLPKALTSRRRVRRLLTKSFQSYLGFKGYFDLYNIPFQYISKFDFTEKKSPLKPNGMNHGSNIADLLKKTNTPHFIGDPLVPEKETHQQATKKIVDESIEFAFIYWAGLDGLLHRVGNQSEDVPRQLAIYEEWINQLMQSASSHYEKVNLHVFSDHGMANCTRYLDLMSKIDSLGLTFCEDYAAVFDSTMARFWFFNENARNSITDLLNTIPQGRILPDDELKKMRTFFEDKYFGEIIFLVQEGVLIVPSHMGERPITAMHGYHPNDEQSYATLLTNRKNLPMEPKYIVDIYKLMEKEVQVLRGQENNTQ